jgi:methionyl-tRNA formyltransferase
VKLVVLTSVRCGTASVCLPVLCESKTCGVARVIVSHGRTSGRVRRLQQKLRKVLRIGVLGALNGLRMRSWYAVNEVEDIAVVCRRLGVPVFETGETNGDETVRLMAEAEADLGLSLGNGYIAPRVFGIPRFGMVNVHGERLPQYQNAQSVIWPIYNDEIMTGLTIHQIDRSIDTGKILYREEYPILFRARLENTVRATVAETWRRTPAAVRHVCENYHSLLAAAVAQEKGRVYTTPSLRQFIRMSRNNARFHRQSRHRAAASRA